MSERLKHKDEFMNKSTITGYNLNTSLKTLVAKSQPHKPVLYIAPDGRYYVKVFNVDADGNYLSEMTDYPYKSLTHLNTLTFSPLHKTAKFYYYPENVHYELVDDLSGSPEFYTNEWEDVKNEKFILDPDTINVLFAANE